MSTIHLIGGEKGGVGKSVVARILAQYFIDHAQSFLGFDCDRSHGALLRFYANYASPIVLDDYQSLDRIVEAAAAEPERRILVDLAAQTHQLLSRWIEDSRVLELLAELNISLVYWHVMDNGYDSVDLLRALLDQFGGRVKLVLVLNQLRGESFEQLASSAQRSRAEQHGAAAVALQRLSDSTMQKIDAASCSFWAAVNHGAGAQGQLGLLERQRLWVWLKRIYEEIDRLNV